MKRVIFCGALCLLLTGCGTEKQQSESSSPSRSSEQEQIVAEETGDIQADKPVDGINNPVAAPEWLAAYTDLGELETPIYLGGAENGDKFVVSENHLLFPESSILLAVGELYGSDREIIRNEADEIREAIRVIEEERVLSEEEARSAGAKQLGYGFSLVLLNANSEYFLVRITSFQDNRHYISIDSEAETELKGVFIQSQYLTELLMKMVGYRVIDPKSIVQTESITFEKDATHKTYICNDEETQQFLSMIQSLEEEANGLCSGPFDVKIQVQTEGDMIRMKWSNDSCGILAIEGKCYEIKGAAQEWISNIVSNKL